MFSNDLDKVIPSLIVANGDWLLERKPIYSLLSGGLSLLSNEFHKNKSKKSILERMFSFMLPKGTRKLKLSKINMLEARTFFMKRIMKKKNVSSCKELLDELLQSEDASIIACAMSMNMMLIKKEELIEGVAKYVSLR